MLPRELDERLGLSTLIERHLNDPRTGCNRQSWSLTSLQQRLFKTGGRLIRHARYFIFQLAESQLTQHLFAQIIRRIERLACHPT